MLWDQATVSQAGADLLSGPTQPQHRGRTQDQHLSEGQQDSVLGRQWLSDDEEDIQEIHKQHFSTSRCFQECLSWDILVQHVK